MLAIEELADAAELKWVNDHLARMSAPNGQLKEWADDTGWQVAEATPSYENCLGFLGSSHERCWAVCVAARRGAETLPSRVWRSISCTSSNLRVMS